MKERLIRNIVIAMSIALIGLMTLQFYWVRNALNITEAQFDQQVYGILADVATEIELLEARRLIDEVIAQEGQVTVKALEQGRSLKQADLTQNKRGAESDSASDGNMGVEIITNTATFKLNDMVVKVSNQGLGSFVQINDSPYSLSDRVGSMSIDSLLRAGFSNQGYELPLEYAISNDSIEVFKTQGYDTSEVDVFTTILFANHSLGYGLADLKVIFPNKRFYLINSSAWMIVLSVVFIAIILMAFIAVVRGFLRQKQLSSVKNDFINNMTHEFKTPIATISLAADSIINPSVIGDKDQLESYSSIIKQESQRMNNNVEAVLQTSLLESKQLNLSFSSLDIKEIVKSACQSIQPSMEVQQGSIQMQLTDHPVMVSGDGDHLMNMLINILDNAIKYSDKVPQVTIGLRQDSNQVILEIKDQGIGIPREYRERVFEKFYRVPTGNLHKVKGFGLGLSYVKTVIEMHGGQIMAEGEPGQGTIFRLIFPLTQ